MAFVFDKNYLCSNQKRCFLILLLFNIFIVCLYYFNGSISQTPNRLTTAIDIDTFTYHKHVSPIKYIQAVLNSEYNREDLVTFYKFAENEFSSGLRCTRKANPTTTIVPATSNLTTDQQTNSSINTNR